MTKMPVPIDPKTGEHVSPVYKRRVSSKIRAALTIRVKEGRTWTECAQRVGLSETAIYKALTQPHVDAAFTEMKTQFIQHVEGMAAAHKARALEIGRELMERSTSDAVKAKMVEFFRGGTGGPTTQTTVNLGVSINSGGYDFLPPGAQMVEIKANAENTAIPADDGQGADDQG